MKTEIERLVAARNRAKNREEYWAFQRQYSTTGNGCAYYRQMEIKATDDYAKIQKRIDFSN